MKKNILLLVASIFLLVACGKKGALPEPEPEPTPEPPEEVVDPPVAFNVTTDAVTYQKGSEVTFKFIGEVDELSFYSGEFLHEHKYHATDRISKSHSLEASFRTNVTNFTAETGQNNQLAVFISSDYNGDNTYASVTAANWKGKDDVTPFFAIAPDTNPWGSSNNFSSGVIELINSFEEDKPIYIGFRYKNTPPANTSGTWPRAWYIYNMNVEVNTLLETNTLFNTVEDFSLVYSDHFNTEELKTSIVTTNIQLNLPPALRPQPAEIWAISPAIDLEKINHGPDTPKAVVKEPTANMPEEYKYIFTEAGTYTVSFWHREGEKEEVKHIELTITE